MENENREIQEQELPEEDILTEEVPQEPSEPRPVWHRIGAWIILVLFVAVVAMYYLGMFRSFR